MLSLNHKKFICLNLCPITKPDICLKFKANFACIMAEILWNSRVFLFSLLLVVYTGNHLFRFLCRNTFVLVPEFVFESVFSFVYA